MLCSNLVAVFILFALCFAKSLISYLLFSNFVVLSLSIGPFLVCSTFVLVFVFLIEFAFVCAYPTCGISMLVCYCVFVCLYVCV